MSIALVDERCRHGRGPGDGASHRNSLRPQLLAQPPIRDTALDEMTEVVRIPRHVVGGIPVESGLNPVHGLDWEDLLLEEVSPTTRVFDRFERMEDGVPHMSRPVGGLKYASVAVARLSHIETLVQQYIERTCVLIRARQVLEEEPVAQWVQALGVLGSGFSFVKHSLCPELGSNTTAPW